MPNEFESVAAVLKMGTKYNIESLRECAIKNLVNAFPTTPEEIDHFSNVLKWSDYGSQLKIAVAVVAFARNLDTPSVLPSAKLLCCFSSKNDMINSLIVSNVNQIDSLRIMAGKLKLRATHVHVLRGILLPGSKNFKLGLKTEFFENVSVFSSPFQHRIYLSSLLC